MKCPRCGNELDASKGVCASCGYVIRLAGQSGSSGRPAANPFQYGNNSYGVLPEEKQVVGDLTNPWRQPGGSSPAGQQPSGDQSNPWRQSQSGGLPPLKQSTGDKSSLPKLSVKTEIDAWQPAQQTNFPGMDALSINNSVPNTPPLSQAFEMPRSTDTLRNDQSYRQSQPLPPLSAGDPFTRGAQQMNTPRPSTLGQRQSNPNVPTVIKPNTQPLSVGPLLPGVLLRGGRYRLQETLRRQDWASGVFEATWIGKDAQRNGGQVMICEMVLPDDTSAATKSILRTATMSLATIGRHPQIPALLDAFSDQGRSFFVFERIEGESLLSRLRRVGRSLPEDEILGCCLQMTEVLELMAQQNPPLVHGLIRPENIILARSNSQYALINFSVVLAGGATQFVVGMDRSQMPPYSAPELVRGAIDTRADMYSLLATAYHVATGNIPNTLSGNVIPARQMQDNISPELDAILTKGLRASANQRYQRPAELREDLLNARRSSGKFIASGNGNGNGRSYSFPGNGQPFNDAGNGMFAQTVLQRPDPVGESLPIMQVSKGDDGGKQPVFTSQESLTAERNSMPIVSILLALGIMTLILIAVIAQIMH